MTLQEFKEKYCNTKTIMSCKQITMDLLSDIEDFIDNGESTDEVKIGAIYYDVTCLMEVMIQTLKDYYILNEMKEDLDLIHKNELNKRQKSSLKIAYVKGQEIIL